MNMMHAFWCIGAILGPLGVANIIRSKGTWQVVFPVFAAMILIMTVLLALQRFPRPEASVHCRRARRRAGAPARFAPPLAGSATVSGSGPDAPGPTTPTRPHPNGRRPPLLSQTGSFVVLCALAIFVYIGVEKGVYSWVSEFFVKVLGSSVSLGAAMVALYWTGQFLGRLGISLSYHGKRLELVLAGLCTLTVGALLALVFVRIVWIAIACTFLAGLANSGIFPLVISLTGRYSTRGRSVGFVTAAGGMAGFLFPIFVASISDVEGMARGFESVFFIALILLLVSILVVARVRRMDRDEASRDRAEARSA